MAVIDRVSVGDLVRVSDLVTDFVKGLVVAIAVIDRVSVGDLLSVTDLVTDRVKGFVVATAE